MEKKEKCIEYYLDSKIFKYIDTDRDIIDIQTYVKLTYGNKL